MVTDQREMGLIFLIHLLDKNSVVLSKIQNNLFFSSYKEKLDFSIICYTGCNNNPSKTLTPDLFRHNKKKTNKQKFRNASLKSFCGQKLWRNFFFISTRKLGVLPRYRFFKRLNCNLFQSNSSMQTLGPVNFVWHRGAN